MNETINFSEITYHLATKKDVRQLKKWFNHYGNKELIKRRINCYIEHNYTIIAKNKKEIIGLMQWQIKENPKEGVVEFEELFINEDYRKQKIATNLINKSIELVKEKFPKTKRIYCLVSENNTSSQKTITALGFKEKANLGKLFNNENEIFYVLEL